MKFEDLIPAKALSLESQSDAIVVSFNHELSDLIVSGKVASVIRKRVPKGRCFKWLYFHIKAPVGAIICRAEIGEIVELTEREVLKFSGKLHLSENEIIAYLDGDPKIGCYNLLRYEYCCRSISTAELNGRLIYHPPQSFFILSKEAKVIVDSLAGFESQ